MPLNKAQHAPCEHHAECPCLHPTLLVCMCMCVRACVARAHGQAGGRAGDVCVLLHTGAPVILQACAEHVLLVAAAAADADCAAVCTGSPNKQCADGQCECFETFNGANCAASNMKNFPPAYNTAYLQGGGGCAEPKCNALASKMGRKAACCPYGCGAPPPAPPR